MSWILAFAGFAALVILHEAGHFLAAKAVGMKVERFFLFFPVGKAKLSMQRGETEYGIGVIPLGGFVKITGMNPDEEVPAEDAHRTYYSAPVWKRIFVIAAGPFVNVLIAFVILFVLSLTLKEVVPTTTVDAVTEDGASAQILEPGDRIVSIDGVTGDFEALRKQISTHECDGEQTDGCEAATPADVTFIRDGDRKTKEITPVYSEADGRPLLGYAPVAEVAGSAGLGVGESANRSLDLMGEITTSTVGVLVRIFDAEQREQISSVVGSYEVTRQAIEFDSRRALLLLAVISLSLAIINLFPFLPLDGGHIFWSIVEKVRGRPIPFSVMERASVVGFVLVLMLFAVGLSNDIERLTGEGFDMR